MGVGVPPIFVFSKKHTAMFLFSSWKTVVAFIISINLKPLKPAQSSRL